MESNFHSFCLLCFVLFDIIEFNFEGMCDVTEKKQEKIPKNLMFFFKNMILSLQNIENRKLQRKKSPNIALIFPS